MKILFIYPNAGSQLGFNYGIAHLSAVLKEAGHDVALWQLCEDIAPLPSQNEFIDRLRQEGADIIGFSVVTNQWPYAKKLAAWARKAVNVPLVCGGIHTMAAAEEILQSRVFDFIIRGEAEEAFAEFVEKIARRQSVLKVKNLGYLHEGKVQLNPLRPLPDVNTLPFKDYDIFEFQDIIDAKNGWVGLIASRGCPFSCTYCFNHAWYQLYTREKRGYQRSVESVIEEVNWVRDHYPLEQVVFLDDLFIIHERISR